MSNPDQVGGIPVFTVIGTPRTMGERIGDRLKSRLQTLVGLLSHRLADLARSTSAEIRQITQPATTRVAQSEPSLWMELESIAHASGLTPADLLLVHGYQDLLSFLGCPLPVSASTYVALPAEQTKNHQPWMSLALHVDPLLLPYLAIVHRIPAHGPASLSLTICGVHPIAGFSEAGLAVASNELRVADGSSGLLTTHQIATILSAPAIDDAMKRAQAGPRFGGRAIHVIDSYSHRFSIELSGQQQARLQEASTTTPRIHTNHALDEGLLNAGVVTSDPSSAQRLGRIAPLVTKAKDATPSDIAAWFGLASSFTATASDGREQVVRAGEPHLHDTEATLLLTIDPKSKQMHVSRGLVKSAIDVFRL